MKKGENNQALKCIYYLCAGRSFRSDQPRRKQREILGCWRSLGYRIKPICGGDSYKSYGTETETAQATTEYFQKWYRQIKPLAPFVNSISEIRDIRHDRLMKVALDKMVKVNRPAIIWERNSRLAAAGLQVARENSVPYILEWKDNLTAYRISLYRRRARALDARKNRQADYIVVESTKIRDNLVGEGVEQGKIIVALNAVDPEEFRVDRTAGQAYRSTLGIRKDQVLIGYIGSYAWYHDMVRLVLAADILKEHKEASFKILMLGTGKKYKGTFQLTKKLNLLDSMVIMKPWVPAAQVPHVLSALDIAVLPGSTDIICPIKVQEYMAMELATVVPDYPCNREVITDGQTGLLFEPKNEQSLADKLSSLAKDSKMRATLGRSAREEVLRRFTWEKTWGKALQEIVARLGIGG